jgi:hypothetical protein
MSSPHITPHRGRTPRRGVFAAAKPCDARWAGSETCHARTSHRSTRPVAVRRARQLAAADRSGHLQRFARRAFAGRCGRGHADATPGCPGNRPPFLPRFHRNHPHRFPVTRVSTRRRSGVPFRVSKRSTPRDPESDSRELEKQLVAKVRKGLPRDLARAPPELAHRAVDGRTSRCSQ